MTIVREETIGGCRLIQADCLEVLSTLEANSVDSIVTDPPYGLGFLGRSWDKVDTPFRADFWQEVKRVLKPGGHMVVFSGTRTYHRMATAVEDAGFEVRDQIQWLFGSGFPKSKNVGGGWGTALKPANEPILLARKPLSERNVAANVLAHGTGAVNVDGCRVQISQDERQHIDNRSGGQADANQWQGPQVAREVGQRFKSHAAGRFPANVIHDGSDEVMEAFAAYGESKSTGGQASVAKGWGEFGSGTRAVDKRDPGFGDTGTAARFFYSAKASTRDRMCGDRKTSHPTVKPISLMAYLCRLITPPGGTVLDPFAGSGTTGMGALREGFRCVLVERETEYVEDIRRRLQHSQSTPKAEQLDFEGLK
jgi:site-specific DNA-methyltransferase (adenine-specific)